MYASTHEEDRSTHESMFLGQFTGWRTLTFGRRILGLLGRRMPSFGRRIEQNFAISLSRVGARRGHLLVRSTARWLTLFFCFVWLFWSLSYTHIFIRFLIWLVNKKKWNIDTNALHLQPLIIHQQLHITIFVDQGAEHVLITSELKIGFLFGLSDLWVFSWIKPLGFCPPRSIGFGGFCTSLRFIEFSRAKGLGNCGFAQSGSGNRRIVKEDLGSNSCDLNQPSERFAKQSLWAIKEQ